MGKEQNTSTCEQRIEKHLESRLDELFPNIPAWGVLKCARYLKSEGRKIQTADIDDLRHEVHTVIQKRAIENLFSVEKSITFELCISGGGPAEYFELDWSPNLREWKGGRYIFQDWFDCASRKISSFQARELARLFGIKPNDE